MHGSPVSASQRGTPSRRGKSPRFSSDSSPQAGSSTLPSNHANKPGSIFVSSLDIPVQGAITIDEDSRNNSSRMAITQSNLPESKRAPRKSKTEALAALNNQSRSSSAGPDEIDSVEDLAARYRNMPPIMVSPQLDLSSVKTWTPRMPSTATRPPRPFGLTDCPEFFPTREEFKDPMAYIKTISSQASQYGICKIIPPKDWKMPFVTDTEVWFRSSITEMISSLCRISVSRPACSV